MTEESTSPPSGQADRPERRSRGPRLPWAVRNAAWRVQERALWPAWDAVRGVPGEATWPLRRAGWTVQRRALWPAQDRLAERSPAVRGGVAALLIALSAGALAGGALLGTSGGGTTAPAPAPATPRLAADTRAQGPVSVSLAAASAGKPSQQVLEGVPPNLRSTIEGDAAKSAAAGDSSASSATPKNPEAAKAPRPPDVPKALAVANRFANAFVLYEVGQADPAVHKTIADTAAKPLADALTKRPPRQPEKVQVPKAKVLNVVPGPLHGTSLSVSVSLLRLGSTSELRLQLQNDRDAGWQVSDVRG
jgi:hypothetical protein